MSYWVQFTTGYNHWPTEIYHQWLQSPTTKLFFGERQTPPNYFFTTWHLNTWDVWQFWQISHELAAVNDDSVNALILWSVCIRNNAQLLLTSFSVRRKEDGERDPGVEVSDCLRALDSARWNILRTFRVMSTPGWSKQAECKVHFISCCKLYINESPGLSANVGTL